jgi:FkbM family methyltransferase
MLTIFVFINLAILVKGQGARSSNHASWQHLNVGNSRSILEQLPSTGLGMSRIDAGNHSFTYAFIAHDEDSFQVKDPAVRALEPGLSALWLAKVKPCCERGGVVIDVGSHFGYYSLLGSALGCSFQAFEPVPDFRSVLEFNIMINRARGIVHPYAVGLNRETVRMIVPATGILGTARITNGDQSNALSVEKRRLDEFVGVTRSENICILKVDVEGYEPEVILSAKELVRSRTIRNVMLEFSPGYSKAGLLDMLQLLYDSGYEAFNVPWEIAKVAQRMGNIEVTEVLCSTCRVDISNNDKRQQFIDNGFFNTNLWLQLK